MHTLTRSIATLMVVAAFGVAVTTLSGQSTKPTAAPVFKYDPTWPKLPLPNRWSFQGVMGVDVDGQDIVWILQRPEDFDTYSRASSGKAGGLPNPTENYAALNPPVAECCVKPPSVMAFDQAGNLVTHWNTKAGGHSLKTDKEGNVWVFSDTLRKFARKDGSLLAAVPRVTEPTPKPGSYPQDHPIIVGSRVDGTDFDEAAREIYLVDNYLNGRVMVFDMDSFKYKRGWGAYGKPLNDIKMIPNEDRYDPKKPPAKDFRGECALDLSPDGFVHVADREANRVQIFTKQGQFVKEIFVAPQTLDRGAAGHMAFSPDNRYLYVGDMMNNHVWIFSRPDGKELGHFGFMGHSGGGFYWLHDLATDSKGNIYTGEVDMGKRIQRFLLQQ